MRQVFSSPRLENVEAVARLLADDGIEIRVSNGRSYRGGIRGDFSYREGSSDKPRAAVWVLRAEQQPRARELLRGAGLLQTGRDPSASFLPDVADAPVPVFRAAAKASAIPRGVRYGLLVLVAVVAGLAFVSFRRVAAPDPALATRPADLAAVPLQVEPTTFVIATPPALAATLLAAELATAPAATACVTIDGAAPASAALDALRAAAPGATLLAAADCADPVPDVRVVDIANYRTDGSGTGIVAVTVGRGDARETRDIAVERDGDVWRALSSD